MTSSDDDTARVWNVKTGNAVAVLSVDEDRGSMQNLVQTVPAVSPPNTDLILMNAVAGVFCFYIFFDRLCRGNVRLGIGDLAFLESGVASPV